MKKGQGVFVLLLIQTLPAFWAEPILLLILVSLFDPNFLDFQVPRFPNCQIPRFPGSQISRPGLSQAWAGLGPGLGWAWVGPSNQGHALSSLFRLFV